MVASSLLRVPRAVVGLIILLCNHKLAASRCLLLPMWQPLMSPEEEEHNTLIRSVLKTWVWVIPREHNNPRERSWSGLLCSLSLSWIMMLSRNDQNPRFQHKPNQHWCFEICIQTTVFWRKAPTHSMHTNSHTHFSSFAVSDNTSSASSKCFIKRKLIRFRHNIRWLGLC